MRFQLERPLKESDYGRKRVVTKFLWFPRGINYEVRWLEGAMIEQVVDRTIVLDRDCHANSWYEYYWKDVRWVDPPINLK